MACKVGMPLHRASKIREWTMKSSVIIGEFVDNCCDLQLAKGDMEVFKLDTVDVLLEVHPKLDGYGVFYTAKGRQWDIWCHAGDVDYQGGAAFAMRNPLQAVRGLLARKWRADFGFNPDEEE
jgi:NADH:ubiquinone oxidoreductase subunit B-like Fe-S oxidoreductase